MKYHVSHHVIYSVDTREQAELIRSILLSLEEQITATKPSTSKIVPTVKPIVSTNSITKV